MCELVGLLVLLRFVLVFFLALLHFVARLLVDRLLQNFIENLLRVWRYTLLLDVLFDLLLGLCLTFGLGFCLADTFMAFKLHIENLLVDLLFLGLLVLFVANVVHLGCRAPDQVRSAV